MQESELVWLAEQASTHKVIVEIGSYAGRSTRALGEHTLGKVIAVDDFLGVEEERPLEAEKSQELYLEFKNKMIDLMDSGKVTVCHPDDIKDIKYKKLVPDMVFIDGDHSYEGVSADIKYWGARLATGGLLCGHDAGHPPIKQAVQELLPKAICAPRTTIWHIVKE